MHKRAAVPAHFSTIEKCASIVRDCTSQKPVWAVILGSGLAPIADRLSSKVIFPYMTLSGFEPTTVIGHPGNLVFGDLEGVPVMAFQGRVHIYEGKGIEPNLAPVRLAAALGVNKIIITNASGAIAKPLKSGDIMAIAGHLNMMWISGNNDFLPVRISEEIYDSALLNSFERCAASTGAPISRGVYAAVTGPTYETPAETRAYGILGADAVGMSTALEAIEARALGMRVLAISCITNDASPSSDSEPGPNHEAVLDAASNSCGTLYAALAAFLKEIP